MTLRLRMAAVIFLLLFIFTSCGGGSPAITGAPDTTGTTGFSSLPGLPPDGLHLRQTLATGPYQFGSGNVHDSSSASFAGSELVFEQGGLAWAILGVNGGGDAPAVLGLTGNLNGYYVGISDYARNRWRWLGGPYNGNKQLILPGGQWCNGSGAFYIAIARPGGAEGRLTISATLETSAAWNVLVWMAGDNDLAQDAADDLNEMETTGSTDQVRVLVGYDIDTEQLNDPVAGTEMVRFLRIVHDTNPLSINTTGDTANISFPRAGYNSADPANLGAFLAWAAQHFPSEHTMLVLWDHGSGWLPGSTDCSAGGKRAQSVLCDDTDGAEDLTDNTVVAAELKDLHFDILGFDACNMGQLEALYDFRGLADYFIASQALEPAAGWDYGYLLAQWNANYPLEPAAIGATAVTGFKECYEADPEEATLAVFDGAQLANLVTALRDLAAVVTPKAEAEADSVKSGITNALELDQSDGCRDLGGFLDAYLNLTTDTAVQARLTAAQNALEASILSFEQVMLPECTGLCAWLPSSLYFDDSYMQGYDSLAFDDATGWLAMLEATGVPEGEEPVNFDLPLLAWEPGYKAVVTWDDSALQFNPALEDPVDFNYGTPQDPSPLAGIIQFSQDSTASGVAEEWGELLASAPAGEYYFYVNYDGDTTATVSMQLLDASDALVFDFGNMEVEGGGLIAVEIAHLFYNDGSFPAAAWASGDYIKVDWGDAYADLELVIEAPDGSMGSPSYPPFLEHAILFSPESTASSTAWESGELLGTAPNGIYAIFVNYIAYDQGQPVPGSITANLKLYDAGSNLKQDLGSLEFTETGYELGKQCCGAILTY